MSEPVVETTAGRIAAMRQDAVYAFKGIPYAAAPVGPRRFRPPIPPVPWNDVRETVSYGPSCPQPADRPEGWSQEPSLSEDCLYLNVWTPGFDASVRRPVLVWLHGGGFSIGSGSWPVYDGAALSRRGDVVVVTVNHRLGIFGYLYLKELAGPEFASAGNAGMLDLVITLEWVRDNIHAFGGDPSNVTIFGESGGGAKVSTLLAMPAARGLFHRAIVQSGPGLRAKLPEQATEVAEKVLSDLGISGGDHRALETVPVERLREAQGRFGRRGVFAFSPVLDGVNVADHPGRAVKNGSAADVPMVIGCNRDEATLFLARDKAFNDAASFDDLSLSQRLAPLGEDANRIIDVYRRTRSGVSPRELLIAIESDRMMRIPSINLAERKLEGGQAPVYMYLFCWAAGPLGSAHGYEIPFVFDNARPPVMQESDERRALAARMSEAWIAFARNGAPDHAGIPNWPAYSIQERATMTFDRGDSHVENDPFGEERSAWDRAHVRLGMPA